MKLTKIISGFALISAMVAGCSDRQEGSDYGYLNGVSPKQPVTLLGKTLGDRRATLFFDADGNTNTTEMVCRANPGWMEVAARVFDSKVGETKTIEEWHKNFSHGKDYQAFWVNAQKVMSLEK